MRVYILLSHLHQDLINNLGCARDRKHMDSMENLLESATRNVKSELKSEEKERFISILLEALHCRKSSKRASFTSFTFVND